MQTNIWHVEAGEANPDASPLRLEPNFFEWFYNHFCAPGELIVQASTRRRSFA
jgi:hypothetical protein